MRTRSHPRLHLPAGRHWTDISLRTTPCVPDGADAKYGVWEVASLALGQRSGHGEWGHTRGGGENGVSSRYVVSDCQ